MSMQEVVINVGSNGSTTSLHFDEFPLNYLGDMRVERASVIRFNEGTQKWDVVLPDQVEPLKAATGFSSYKEGRDFEVRWLQQCMIQEVPPQGTEGERVAKAIREATQ